MEDQKSTAFIISSLLSLFVLLLFLMKKYFLKKDQNTFDIATIKCFVALIINNILISPSHNWTSCVLSVESSGI